MNYLKTFGIGLITVSGMAAIIGGVLGFVYLVEHHRILQWVLIISAASLLTYVIGEFTRLIFE